MAESDPIKHDELIEPKVFQPTIDNARELIAIIEEVIAQFRKLTKEAGNELRLLNPKTVADMERMEKIEKRILDLEAAYNAAMKEKIRLTKQLSESEDKQVEAKIKYNMAVKEQNTILKQKIQLEKAEKGSIDEMRIKLSQVTKEYNALSGEMRDNSNQGKLLAQQKLELTNRLKELEGATGDHRRNVGNYTQALSGLGHVITNVAKLFGFHTEGLEEMEHAFKQTTGAMKGFAHVHHAAKEGMEQTTGAMKKQNEEQKKSTSGWFSGAAALGFWLAIATAVVAVTYAIIEAITEHSKAEEERSKAIDGTIIKNKELREEHNKTLFELQRLAVEYKRVSRQINDFEAGMQNLKISYDETLEDIKEKTKEKLNEGIGFWDAFGLLWKKGLLNATQAGMEERNRIIEEFEIKARDEMSKSLNDAKAKIEEERRFQERELLRLEKMRNDASKETTEKKIEALRIQSRIDIDAVKESNAIESTKAGMIEAINKKLAKDIEKIYLDIAMKKAAIDEQIFKDTIERQKRVLTFNAQQAQIYADLTISNDVELANTKLKIRRDLQLELDAIDQEALIRDSELRIKQIEASTEDEGVKAKMILQIRTKLNEDLSKLRETSEQREIEDQRKVFADLEKFIDEESKREIDRIKKENDIAKKERQEKYSDEQKLRLVRARNNKELLDAQIKNEREAIKKQLDDLDDLYNAGLIKQEEYERKREIIQREGTKKLSDMNRKYIEQGIDLLNQIVDQTKIALDEKLRYEQQINDRRLQQDDAYIRQQQELASRGLDNTLAYAEKKKAEDLERQARLDKKKHKEEEALQLANLFLEFAKGYAKDGSASANAKALAQTLIAKGFSELIANSFATGVENLQGPGTETSDSIPALLSKGESVATAKATRDNPGLVTAMNMGTVGDYFKSVYFPRISGMPLGRDQGMSMAGFRQIDQRLQSLEKTIRDKKELTYSLNEQKEWVETSVEKGIKRIIIHKDRKI